MQLTGTATTAWFDYGEAADRGRSPVLRLLGLGVIVALAAYLVGEQVDRPLDADARGGRAAGAELQRSEATGFDVDAVIDGVRHHVVEAAPGRLVVDDAAYGATFDDTGFRVGQPGGAPPWFGLSVTTASRGGSSLPVEPGRWTADANVAERPIATGAVERVTAREGTLEWDVVLSAPPAGSGALRVEATVQAAARPERHGNSWRWRDGKGAHVDMGELVVVDAAGRELHRALPAVDGNVLTFAVPNEVLEEASYPLTIDPVISPEHPVAPTVIDGPGGGGDPAVAFDGTNYLVAWNGRGGLRAARFTPDGALLDPQPLLVAATRTSGEAPAVAFGGTNYLVVWATGVSSDESDIRGARISTDGLVLDPGGFVIADPNVELFPDVAFDGTDYVVLWTDNVFADVPLVLATRIDTDGRLVDPSPRVIPDARSGAAIASDGTNLLVTWTGPSGVEALQMTPDGTVLEPGVIRVSAATVIGFNPDVAFDGIRWVIAWPQYRPDGLPADIYAARVSRMGRVLDPANIAVSTGPGERTDVSIARSGNSNVLIAWRDAQQGGDIFGARLSRPGVVLDPAGIPLATGPGLHQTPALATGTGQVLLTFTGHFGERCCPAQAVRISPAGGVLDPSPRVVSQQSNSQFRPQVASDGTNYLVVWEDDRNDDSQYDLMAARVTPAGESLDPAGVLVARLSSSALVDVAFNGTNFVVLYSGVSEAGDFQVLTTIVRPDGTLLTPTPVVIAAGGVVIPTDLSPDGTNTMVLWHGPSGVFAARLSPTGEVLDPGGIVIAGPEESGGNASAAFDGTNHLVTYSAGEATGDDDIVARRVSAGGQVIDATPLLISTTPDRASSPAVAWSGTVYLVAWSGLSGGGQQEHVWVARVGSDGTVLTPGPVVLPQEEVGQGYPHVASSRGWFLVTMTRLPRWDVGEIVGVRVHENGSMPDRAAFTIGEGFVGDVVAGADGRWGTVYFRNVGPPTGADRVFLRTVTPK